MSNITQWSILLPLHRTILRKKLWKEWEKLSEEFFRVICSLLLIEYKSTGHDQSSRNACSSSPCLHGGECVPKGSSFLCRCKSPYYGSTCSKRRDWQRSFKWILTLFPHLKYFNKYIFINEWEKARKSKDLFNHKFLFNSEWKYM